MGSDDQERRTDVAPRVAISACLLGQAVRYDGGHKRDRFLTDAFGPSVQWAAVCPEAECGLPTPREPMRLEGDPDSPRLVAARAHVDHTDRMLTWAQRRLDEFVCEGLCGFILKAGSPSCGMRGVGIHGPDGVPREVGVGLFARALMARFPLLPVEDEERLRDPALRESFIERVFALGLNGPFA